MAATSQPDYFPGVLVEGEFVLRCSPGLMDWLMKPGEIWPVWRVTEADAVRNQVAALTVMTHRLGAG